MIEEVLTGIFRIVMPRPDSQPDTVNSYVIMPGKGERALIIDPGLGLDLCRDRMTSVLETLHIDHREADYFITHSHVDHCDLAPRLLGSGSVIYMNKADAAIMVEHKTKALVGHLNQFCRTTGFPACDFGDILASVAITGDEDRGDELPFRFVEDGDVFQRGVHRFLAVSTPGHTVGHTCLYEPEKKVLFSGDHLLGDITPSMLAWTDGDTSLRDYYESLDKILSLDVETVLPGHNEVFSNCRERIEEMRNHYQSWTEEVFSVLTEEGMDAFGTASQIIFNLTGPRGWKCLSLLYQFYVTSDVLAHLKYLEQKGRVARTNDGERIVFSRTVTER